MIGLRKLMTGQSEAQSAAPAPLERFRVGRDIVADPVRHTITRNGQTVAVEPGVMRLLTYFAARPERIISKEELREQVWGTHVVDQAVHRAISLLRSALGDTPRNSTIIETIPRHGYRLLVAPAAVGSVARGPLGSRRFRLAAAVVGVAALALLLAPTLRSGAADAPELPAFVPQAAQPAPAGAVGVGKVERPSISRGAVVAPESATREAGSRSRTPAVAPKAPVSASAEIPALAPMAPGPRTRPAAQAPAPPSAVPAAEGPTESADH